MKKNIYMFAVLLAVILVIALGTDIKSVDEYYLIHAEDIKPDSETVTLEIRCDTILDNYDKLKEPLRDEKYVPADGVILKETRYVLRPGDTVFDILSRACRINEIQMEYEGVNENYYNTAYVEGINYLYDFSCGRLSGWMFCVNGGFADKGANQYELKDGDKIQWLYTCDLGKDIGNEYIPPTGS